MNLIALIFVFSPSSFQCHPGMDERQGERAAETVEVRKLARGLGSSDNEVRRKAVIRLSELGKKAEPATSELCEALGQAGLRWHAQQALVQIGAQAIPRLVVCLDSRDPEVRAAGAGVLGLMKPPPKSTARKLLALMLADKSKNVKLSAENALSLICDPDILPDLLRHLDCPPNESVRGHIAGVLGYYGPAAKPAIPTLITMLVKEECDCDSARRALTSMGPLAVPELSKLIQNETARKFARINAAQALEWMVRNKEENENEVLEAQKHASAATAALVKLLRDKDADLRIAAAETLKRFGSWGFEAKPALTKALEDREYGVRHFVADALLRIDPINPDARELLIRDLKDKDPEVRSHAACVVGYVGRAAASLIPYLRVALRDTDSDVRRNAASSLGIMRGLAISALPDLRKATRDPDPQVRSDAEWAIGAIESYTNRENNPPNIIR